MRSFERREVLAALGAAAGAGLGGCTGAPGQTGYDGWRMTGQNPRNTAANLDGVDLAAPPDLGWSHPGKWIVATPETAYIGSGAGVRAVGAHDGRVRARVTSTVSVPVGVLDGRLYAMSGEWAQVCSAFDVDTGEEQWLRDAQPRDTLDSTTTSTVRVTDDTVYRQLWGLAISGDVGEIVGGPLAAIDAATGAVRWREQAVAAAVRGPDRTYVLSDARSGPQLQARRTGGGHLWNVDVSPGDPSQIQRQQPVAADDAVYLVERDRGTRLVRFDAATGERAARTPRFPGLGGVVGVAVTPDQCVIAVDETTLVAFDRSLSIEQWRVDIPDFEARHGQEIRGGPVATAETIYVSDSAGAIHALETDGTVHWSQQYGATVRGVTAAGLLVLDPSPGSGRVGVLR